jgi:predicted nucleotidyltransferase
VPDDRCESYVANGKDDLLHRVLCAVQEEDPDAQVLLYGSRARGDAAPDSDWDLLVLLSVPATQERKQAIRYRLYEIEWETGAVLSTVIHTMEEWDSPPLSMTPLHENVLRERIVL